jgi:phosphate transport system substrate-binding protein
VTKKVRGWGLLTVVVAVALFAAACGDDSGSSSATTAAGGSGASTTAATADTGASTTAGAPVSGTLQGSGSSFSLAFLQEAASEFNKANPGANVTYGGGGSGKGRTDLVNKTVDYAGSDSPFKDTEKPPDPILYFPILLGPITISYNLKGVDTLNLSPDTIAGIFETKITKWNDPAIAADNPGVQLPATQITVAHRSDGSGTTQNFTEWLALVAPNTWTLKSGSTVEWPASTQAGNGNQGVAQIVQSTDGAIGYIDLSDAVAANLAFASVKNQAGKFIQPTSEAASAAGNGVDVNPDLTFHAYNSSDPAAYPITAQTFVIIYTTQTDAAKGDLVKAFISYLLTDGQSLLTDLDYAPLPKTLQDKAVAQLDQITVG